MNASEIWKDVPGYEAEYQVSSFGRVKSKARKSFHRRGHVVVKEAILKLDDKKGYKRVALLGTRKFFVHRLVASAFIPNPEGKPSINHKNGVKSDNAVENLEWVTKSENSLHAYNVLGCKTNARGVYQYDRSGNLICFHRTIEEAENNTGIGYRMISRVALGKRNHTHNFIFSYNKL